MRRGQPTQVRTGSVKKRLCVVTALLLVAVLAGALYIVTNFKKPYVPPRFDSAQVVGVPTPPENMRYGQIGVEKGFSFNIAGTMYQQKDGSLCVYLTNPADSGINILCEVTNTDGVALYRSGAIRPGEYVERLSPLCKLPDKAIKIQIKVYAFEPKTWYSKGSINLTNILQPK